MTQSDHQRQARYWAHVIRGSRPWSRFFWGARVGVPLTTYADRSPGMLGGAGWIYAISEDRTPLVKIWCTGVGPRTRLCSLVPQFRTDLLLVGAVFLDALLWEAEGAIHKRLAPYRIEREWFYLPMNQEIFEA